MMTRPTPLFSSPIRFSWLMQTSAPRPSQQQGIVFFNTAYDTTICDHGNVLWDDQNDRDDARMAGGVDQDDQHAEPQKTASAVKRSFFPILC